MQEVIHKAEIGFAKKLSTTPAETLQEQWIETGAAIFCVKIHVVFCRILIGKYKFENNSFWQDPHLEYSSSTEMNGMCLCPHMC